MHWLSGRGRLVVLSAVLVAVAGCGPVSQGAGPTEEALPSPLVETSAPIEGGPTAVLLPATPEAEGSTAVPAASETPVPQPQLVRLTVPGCCVQPFWSPDGSRLLFIDKPTAESISGLYAINPETPGAVAEFYSARPGMYSSDMTLVVYPEGRVAVVENLVTGEKWPVNTNGNAPAFAPDGSRILWQDSGAGGGTTQPTDVYLANIDGTEAGVITTITGGNVSAWFPDSRRLLVNTRPAANSFERVLSVLDLADGSLRELVRANRINSIRLSTQGSWLAFFTTFSDNVNDDGIWLVQTESGERKHLDLFGAYQWRDDGRLLVIPMEPGEGSHVLWEIEAETGAAQQLTDPQVTPFMVANGDWTISPDGTRIAFVNAADQAIWLLTLP